MAKTIKKGADEAITPETNVKLTLAQIATIVSVILTSIVTIAYAIGSFMQTTDIVKELKRTSEIVEKDVEHLKIKSDTMSVAIRLNILRLEEKIAASKASLEAAKPSLPTQP